MYLHHPSLLLLDVNFLQVVNHVVNTRSLPSLLCSLGMMPYDEDGTAALIGTSDCYVILLDGKVMGKVPDNEVVNFVAQLRQRKIHRTDNVSIDQN